MIASTGNVLTETASEPVLLGIFRFTWGADIRVSEVEPEWLQPWASQD